MRSDQCLAGIAALLTCAGISGCDGGPEATYEPDLQATAAVVPDASSSADSSEAKQEAMSDENEAPSADGQRTVTAESYNPLNKMEAYVILEKGTEPPGPGGYTLTKDPGTYICRRCNAVLYRSEDKFESHCGWPSFDDEVEGAVKRQLDADGFRTEIICSNCGGHLGHVFEGEGFTPKDTRHCVNSISMKFIPKGEEIPPRIELE